MRLHFHLIAMALAMALSIASCGGNTHTKTAAPDAPVTTQKAKGDSTVYGMACDGCTDSVLVFLGSTDGDPDTFDIIDARLQHRVMGKPRIGHNLALMLNPEDSSEATLVIDLNDLQGEWCYQATPKMRDLASLPKRVQRRMMASMPDSVKERLLVPKEFGFELKSSFAARPIGLTMGSATTEDQSPVEYPPVKVYSEWAIYNGKLLLTEERADPTGKGKPTMTSDTAVIKLLMPDTLVLAFPDGERGYYRKNK